MLTLFTTLQGQKEDICYFPRISVCLNTQKCVIKHINDGTLDKGGYAFQPWARFVPSFFYATVSTFLQSIPFDTFFIIVTLGTCPKKGHP